MAGKFKQFLEDILHGRDEIDEIEAAHAEQVPEQQDRDWLDEEIENQRGQQLPDAAYAVSERDEPAIDKEQAEELSLDEIDAEADRELQEMDAHLDDHYQEVDNAAERDEQEQERSNALDKEYTELDKAVEKHRAESIPGERKSLDVDAPELAELEERREEQKRERELAELDKEVEWDPDQDPYWLAADEPAPEQQQEQAPEPMPEHEPTTGELTPGQSDIQHDGLQQDGSMERDTMGDGLDQGLDKGGEMEIEM